MQLVPHNNAIGFTYPSSMAEIRIAYDFDIKLEDDLRHFGEFKDALKNDKIQSARDDYLGASERFRLLVENSNRIINHLRTTYIFERDASDQHKRMVAQQREAQEAEVRKIRASLREASSFPNLEEARASSSTATAMRLTTRPMKRKERPSEDGSGDEYSADAGGAEGTNNPKRPIISIPRVVPQFSPMVVNALALYVHSF